MNRNLNYRVMIVDDELIFRTGLTHLHDWSKEGIQIVAQASNGEEALLLIEEVKPHVVITDIMMPVLDGIEFSKIMKKKYPNIKLIVLSSYSEFDLVREVFKYGVTDYLLKPKVTAQEIVQVIHSLQLDYTNRELVEKKEQDISILMNQWLADHDGLQEEELNYITQYFNGPFIQLMYADSTLMQFRQTTSQYELETKIIQSLQNKFGEIKCTASFYKNDIMIVINYKEGVIDQVTSGIQAFGEEMKSAYHDLTFVHHAHIASIEQVKSEFHHLKLLSNKLFYFSNTNMVEAYQLNIAEREVHFNLQSFVESLKLLMLSKAEEQIYNHIDEIIMQQALNEYEVKRFFQHVIYTMFSTLEHLKLPMMERSSQKLIWFKKIDLVKDVQELKVLVKQFFVELERQLSEHTDIQQSGLLNHIIEYIHEHYQHDISLSELAEQFHMNYSYLSWYFKQKTNENLTSYINRVRIEKGKELLVQTTDSISQISSQIGFSEHNYFSKVFKKMTGMTPNEYRNIHGHKTV